MRGHEAIWLRVAASRSAYPKGSAVFVAVDEKTGAAVAHRVPGRGKRVVCCRQDIDIVAHRRKLPSFVLPPLTIPPLPPAQGHGRGGGDVTLAQAARILPGALWAGRTVAGQPFRRARAIALDNGKTQIELRYGGACPAHCIRSSRASWPAGHPAAISTAGCPTRPS